MFNLKMKLSYLSPNQWVTYSRVIRIDACGKLTDIVTVDQDGKVCCDAYNTEDIIEIKMYQ